MIYEYSVISGEQNEAPGPGNLKSKSRQRREMREKRRDEYSLGQTGHYMGDPWLDFPMFSLTSKSNQVWKS